MTFYSSLMMLSLVSKRSLASFVDRLDLIFYKMEEMSVALSHGIITGKGKSFLDFYSVMSEVKM
jgi:hypothetical protein